MGAGTKKKRKKRSPRTQRRYKENEKAAKAAKTKQVEEMAVAFENNKKVLAAARAAIQMGEQNLVDMQAAAEDKARAVNRVFGRGIPKSDLGGNVNGPQRP